MKQILVSLGIILVLTGAGIARQAPPAQRTAPATQPNEALPQVSENYVIGVEDVLSINVWKETELSQPQIVVRPDGKITLPVIGDVQAAGLTTKQLRDNLVEKLKDLVIAPTVTVIVTKIESQKVSIVGNVAKQGTYPLGSPVTVLELIARAGGLTEYAKSKSITILRKKDGKTLNFNYNDVIKGKNLQQNIVLENGDIVMVR